MLFYYRYLCKCCDSLVFLINVNIQRRPNDSTEMKDALKHVLIFMKHLFYIKKTQ